MSSYTHRIVDGQVVALTAEEIAELEAAGSSPPAPAITWAWPTLAFLERLYDEAGSLEGQIEDAIQAGSRAMLSLRNQLVASHEVVTGPPGSMDEPYLRTKTSLDGLALAGLLTQEQVDNLLAPFEEQLS